MSDDADRHLEARLHALAGGVNPPIVPAGDDVRRGRRRLLRMRVAMAGATGGALAVVLGITGLAAGDPTATEIPPAQQPPTSLTTTPSQSPSDETVDGDPERQPDAASGTSGAGPDPTQSADDATDDADATGRTPGGGRSPHGSGAGSWAGAHQLPSQGGSASVDGQSPSAETTAPPTGATGEASPSGLPSPSGSPSGSATASPSGTPTAAPPTVVPTAPPTDGVVRVHATLTYWNDVLATHLDPTRAHLLPHTRSTGNVQSTWIDGELFALGSRFVWAGEGRTETLQLRVASGWDQAGWACGDTSADWECHDGALPDSEVAEHDGARQVAVEHEDGQVVVLTADDSYDGADEQGLLEAAADERLTLPGEAPLAPPTLDPDGFAMAGQALLVLGELDETWVQTALDRAPTVTGDRSVDGRDRGELSWSAAPVYSGAAWSCLETYRSCTDVQVGDATVHVAALKAKAGGGWIATHEGAAYVVSVYSADPTLPRKRALAFVTDPAWQPTR